MTAFKAIIYLVGLPFKFDARLARLSVQVIQTLLMNISFNILARHSVLLHKKLCHRTARDMARGKERYFERGQVGRARPTSQLGQASGALNYRPLGRGQSPFRSLEYWRPLERLRELQAHPDAETCNSSQPLLWHKISSYSSFLQHPRQWYMAFASSASLSWCGEKKENTKVS